MVQGRGGATAPPVLCPLLYRGAREQSRGERARQPTGRCRPRSLTPSWSLSIASNSVLIAPSSSLSPALPFASLVPAAPPRAGSGSGSKGSIVSRVVECRHKAGNFPVTSIDDPVDQIDHPAPRRDEHFTTVYVDPHPSSGMLPSSVAWLHASNAGSAGCSVAWPERARTSGSSAGGAARAQWQAGAAARGTAGTTRAALAGATP